jgi:hypothetical protein
MSGDFQGLGFFDSLNQRLQGDAFQRPLVPRSRFQGRLKRRVGLRPQVSHYLQVMVYLQY